MKRPLSGVIFGEPGVGKTRLFCTAPGRKLILDAESGSTFIKLPKVFWNPLAEQPPEIGAPSINYPDRPWELCVVLLHEFRQLGQVDAWLKSGAHPFQAVGLDTIGEVQKRLIDQLNPSITSQTSQGQWGEILRTLEDLMRRWRDLTVVPENPLEMTMVLAHSEFKNDRHRPWVKGQFELSLPGFFDIVGYLYTEITPESPTKPTRKLRIDPSGVWVAKDRTGSLNDHYGQVISNPNLTEMLSVVHGPEEGPTT